MVFGTSSLLCYGLFLFRSQAYVAHLPIGLCAIPDSALSIFRHVSGSAFAVRCGVFDYLAGFGVQLSDHIRVHGRIPEVVVVIDADSVRGWHRSRQLELLKRLGLGIKPREVSAKIVAEPYHAL